jgi:hypothetical protein
MSGQGDSDTGHRQSLYPLVRTITIGLLSVALTIRGLTELLNLIRRLSYIGYSASGPLVEGPHGGMVHAPSFSPLPSTTEIVVSAFIMVVLTSIGLFGVRYAVSTAVQSRAATNSG